jgi:hypothetical protein
MTNYIPARLTRLEDQEPVIMIEEDENVQQHELREDEIFNDLYEREEGISYE